MAYDVFISHSSANKVIADAICHALEQNGIRCWIAPRDIQAGSLYGEQITKGIRECKVFLLVFSDEVNRSSAVQKELERAVLGYQKTVIPYRIEDVPMNDNIEFFLGDVHWIDAYPDDTVFDSLVKAVEKILGEDSEKASINAVEEKTFNYDVHNELLECFDELFGGDNDSENENPLQPVDYLGQQLIELQQTHNLKEKTVGNFNNKKSSVRITDNIIGRHFTWYNSPGTKTMVFKIDRLLLQKSSEWVCLLYPVELEYIEQSCETGASNQVFYLDHPEDCGYDLVLLSFDKNNNCVHMNAGVLEQNKILVSKTPQTMFFKPLFDTADALAKILNLTKEVIEKEEQECDYTFDLFNSVILLDPEKAEMVKPTFTTHSDGYRIKGKVKIVPFKSYFAFQINEIEDTEFDVIESNSCVDEYEIGMAYKFGWQGLNQNLFSARQWLEKTIANDEMEANKKTRALYELACLYANGKIGFTDKKRALDYLQLAIEQGNDDARFLMAYIYEMNPTLNEKKEKAITLYKKSSQKGHLVSMLSLAYFYENGIGVEQDNEKAKSYIKKCIRQYDLESIYDIAEAFLKGFSCNDIVDCDTAKALYFYNIAAEYGDNAAKNKLADMYVDGVIVEQDYEKAFEYWKSSSDDDDVTGTNNLGWLYKCGYGVEQDYNKARILFEKAIEMGSRASYTHLGEIYLNGWGVEQSDSKAHEYFEKGSELGNRKCSNALAVIYETGQDVNCDAIKALEYYKLAYKQGLETAKEKVMTLAEELGLPTELEE